MLESIKIWVYEVYTFIEVNGATQMSAGITY